MRGEGVKRGTAHMPGELQSQAGTERRQGAQNLEFSLGKVSQRCSYLR